MTGISKNVVKIRISVASAAGDLLLGDGRRTVFSIRDFGVACEEDREQASRW
jgi:hypothetical protein